jgi:hypothetical protein
MEGLGGFPERVEPSSPESLEELADLVQTLYPGPVKAVAALGPDGDQAGLAEDAEVLRRGGAAEAGSVGDLGRGPLAVPHDLQDLAPGRVRDRPQGRLHGVKLSRN